MPEEAILCDPRELLAVISRYYEIFSLPLICDGESEADPERIRQRKRGRRPQESTNAVKTTLTLHADNNSDRAQQSD